MAHKTYANRDGIRPVPISVGLRSERAQGSCRKIAASGAGAICVTRIGKSYANIIMFVSIISFGLSWLVGLVIGSFFLAQPGIILFFGIPTTKKLQNAKLLIDDAHVIRQHWVSFFIQVAILAAVTVLIFTFWPSGVLGYLIGMAVILLLSRGKLGATETNVREYMNSNAKYLKQPIDREKIVNALIK